MKSKRVAKWLSVILGPLFWLPALFLIIIFKSGLAPSQIKILFPTIFTLQVIMPQLYLYIGPKLGWITSWEMNDREERKSFFILILILSLISLSIIYLIGTDLLLNLSLILLALLILLLIITRYWKISLHTAFNTGATLVINYLFNWKLSLLYLTIPLIYWARLKLKRHTVSQLFSGIVVALVIILGGFFLFGLI